MITLEKIVGFALQDRRVMDQLGEALRSDLVVANPLYRQIATFADDFALEYRALPRAGDWEVWLSSLSEQQRGGIREALGRLLSQDISEYEPEYFGEQVIEELKRTASKTALSRLNTVGEVTPEALKDLSEQVDRIATGGITGMADLRDVDLWMAPPGEEELIPTGFPELDRFIGGWGEELWIIFADSGIGKSMFLQNCGASAAQKGKRVLHVTLELGLRPLIHRYYRQIAKEDRSRFVTDPAAVKSRLGHWFRFAKGDVTLIEFPAYSTDPEALQRVIDRINRLHGAVDLVIIDYLDLLNLPPRTQSRGGYEDLGRITHLVRGYCPAFSIPVLTASQAVRKPQHKNRLTIKDMGDSYGKVRGADGLLSLVQSEEELEVRQGRVGILKARDSGGMGVEIPVYINRELAVIADLDHPNTLRLMEKLGHLPKPKEKGSAERS